MVIKNDVLQPYLKMENVHNILSEKACYITIQTVFRV